MSTDKTTAITTNTANPLSDLRGASRLTIDAIAGVTDIVENMHRNIARVSPIVGKAPPGPARGLSGLVYRGVRGVTRAVGFGLDTVLGQLAPLIRSNTILPQRESTLAALNGVLGDYLAATENPLAIAMRFRRDGVPLVLEKAALKAEFGRPSGKLLVLVHGLCMNDIAWTREGHDHGEALAQDLGYIPLYLQYNSGRHISINGREFAATLEQLLRAWPVPVTELAIVGHSMGGLVARSACHYGAEAGHAWRRSLKKLVFLGTPHHGAPLERAGNWVDILVGISPYTAPFARLGKVRSAGIKDLRHGDLLDEDWMDRHSERTHDSRRFVPLPAGVRCFAVAATKEPLPGGKRLKSDGLVPVKSALGQHRDPALSLPIPPSRQRVFHGLDHFDLLSSREVGACLGQWLAGTAQAKNK
jgi:pimeloyl-ACP methyl ester carboxylesterase